MKHSLFIFIATILIGLMSVLFVSKGFAQGERNSCASRTILIVASYNPDTRRMQDFIKNFEDEVATVFSEMPNIVIEDLASRGLSEADQWEGRIAQIIESHKEESLMSIILLGQEAWAGYLKYCERTKVKVPSYGCFVSSSGIRLPDAPIVGGSWNPESVDMIYWGKKLSKIGGQVNHYDVLKNIELVGEFFPMVSHLVLITDNSYGGRSLKSLVESKQSSIKGYTLQYIDGSKISHQDAIDSIGNLQPNSALLLGTWRVSTDGQYFGGNAVEELVKKNPKIPAISLTGAGIGLVAVGGYVPQYTDGAQAIARNLYRYYYHNDSVGFFVTANQFVFEKRKLKSFGIESYRLPNGSQFIDNLELKIEQYEYYLFCIICIGLLAVCLLIFISVLLLRNRRNNVALILQADQLKQAKARAEESERIKSAFLANMSHEIRTPLNSIVGFSSILSDETSTSEERNEYGQIIIKNADILLSLINDILDISRLESGQIVFHKCLVSVNELCAQGMNIIQGVKKNGIDYYFMPCQPDVSIVTDELRVLQVLNNLLSNANKFTDSGSISLVCQLSQDRKNVVFSVTDTGCGIAPEKRDSVFSRFEKLNEFKQGTGLGLAISLEIVTHLGGKIYVDPDYNLGAKFVFSLPLEVS